MMERKIIQISFRSFLFTFLFLNCFIPLRCKKEKKIHTENLVDLSLNISSEMFKISFILIPLNLISFYILHDAPGGFNDCEKVFKREEKEKNITYFRNCIISPFNISGKAILFGPNDVFFLENISVSISDGPIFLDEGNFEIKKTDSGEIFIRKGTFYFIPFESEQNKIRYDVSNIRFFYDFGEGNSKFKLALDDNSKIKGRNEASEKFEMIVSRRKNSYFLLSLSSSNIHLIDLSMDADLNVSLCAYRSYNLKVYGKFTFDFQTFFLGYFCPVSGYLFVNSGKIKFLRYNASYLGYKKNCMSVEKCL